MSSVPALSAIDVGKVYPRHKTQALANVSLAIAPHRIVALVGPNGAGKSTLIRAWIGFERPTHGSVRVDGRDPFIERSLVLDRIGYVPQRPSLYPALTVEDHVNFAFQLRPSFDRRLALRRLDDLNIPRQHRGNELSGGQQAQVALALAIGTRASILLLDEPLASLDPLARREFLFIVASYVRECGATALLSSHVVSDVEQAADQLIVLGTGRVLLDADVKDALAAHQVVVGDVQSTDESIGSFVGIDGQRHTLIRRESARAPRAREASIEDVMLGYLAASRPTIGDGATGSLPWD